MSEARYFLAHAYGVEQAELNAWRAQLLELLVTPGYTPKVTLGQEDYNKFIWNLGNWESWASDVAQRTDYRGEPAFHGVIVPVVSTFTIGKATADILRGFWQQGKHRFVFSPHENALRPLAGVRVLDRTDYKQHAELVL